MTVTVFVIVFFVMNAIAIAILIVIVTMTFTVTMFTIAHDFFCDHNRGCDYVFVLRKFHVLLKQTNIKVHCRVKNVLPELRAIF